MSLTNKKIAIIGGGISGLTAGYLLAKRGAEVTVFEKDKELGGLLSDFEIGGKRLEKAYHHIFKTDKSVIRLIKDLGLQSRLVWHESKTALFWDKKMYSFAGPMDLLKFKPLPFWDRIRTGLVALYLQKDKNWEKFEKITAYEWMEKWAGEKAYKVIWEPLLKGKFHDRYKDISMAWLWARIHTRVGSKDDRGKEVLGYLDGGFGQIIDRLAQEIEKRGGKVKTNNQIMDRHDGLSLQKLENDFDFIIDTRPAKTVDYLGAIDVVFSSKQNLSPYYWHNINDPDSPFLAFIQHTNLVDKQQYGNKNIYYMGTYVPQDHRYFSVTDKTISNEFFDYLKKILPEFKPEKVLETKVFKMKYAQHIVDLRYRSKIPLYKQSEKVFNLNFAQIYPEDRGINYAVKEARKVEEMVR